ncbi:MAG: phosphotransferase [Pseudomonadota bacterium]
MTTERRDAIAQFLSDAGWQGADAKPLAGDASNRSYQRLHHRTNGAAILMDASSKDSEDTRPFIKIAQHLNQIGLSAPEILAQDIAQGFLLIEDFGDDLFADLLQDAPKRSAELYHLATDALLHMQAKEPPAQLPRFGATEMSEAALLVADWYLEQTSPNPPKIREEIRDALFGLLTKSLCGRSVMIHRDYHVENLILLPNRTGVARLGMLDFQDAMLGDPAYDLASLLKDARRDVTPTVQASCIAQFIEALEIDKDHFDAAFACCSAQRNLRILGIFARLSIRDGKTHYLDLLPRVWRNLVDDLSHPALTSFGEWILDILPEPSPALIAKLKTTDV